jgi:hypothetical protein
MISSFTKGELCGSWKMFARSLMTRENSLAAVVGVVVELGERCTSVRGSDW